jgi:hypothetical protein
MFQGTKSKLLIAAIAMLTLSLGACSSGNYKKADCFSCTTEAQSWKKFSWSALEGRWTGTVETITNSVTARSKVRKEEKADIIFISGKKFWDSYKITENSCGTMPMDSVVMVGQAWGSQDQRSFEVFGKAEDDKVIYGRAEIRKVGAGNVCYFKKLGSNVGMNRLGLPAVTFSQRHTANGRRTASGNTPESNVSFEFLNFDPKLAEAKALVKGGRSPSSVIERAPLFFRSFQIHHESKGAYSDGQWSSTKEYLYRLWKLK